MLFADAAVELQAPYVALGTVFQSPVQVTQLTSLSFGGPTYVQPIFGPGSLTVRAALIDIGNLSFAEHRSSDLHRPTVATSAAMARSTWRVRSNCAPAKSIQRPRAGSPSRPYDYQDGGTTQLGSVVITGSGSRALPLSAGGQLNIYASNIRQGGTLRAPLGTINLGWDGTGTSPTDYLSGAGLVTGKTVAVTQQLTLASGKRDLGLSRRLADRLALDHPVWASMPTAPPGSIQPASTSRPVGSRRKRSISQR
ncbi:MAG: hypothetical protein WDN28_21940 [Chthoniobacter sp.]